MKKLVVLVLAASLALVCLAVGQASPKTGFTKPALRLLFKPKAGQTVLQLFVENRGDVYIDLNTKDAPKTTSQIIYLAKGGFYDGQTFFKVMKSPRPYLVQSGDPLTKTENQGSDKIGTGGSGTTIPYEDTHQECFAGSVLLATSNGNRDSGDSQFVILLGDYDNLLRGTATVFGHVVLGMENVNKIEQGDKIVTATILTG